MTLSENLKLTSPTLLPALRLTKNEPTSSPSKASEPNAVASKSPELPVLGLTFSATTQPLRLAQAEKSTTSPALPPLKADEIPDTYKNQGLNDEQIRLAKSLLKFGFGATHTEKEGQDFGALNQRMIETLKDPVGAVILKELAQAKVQITLESAKELGNAGMTTEPDFDNYHDMRSLIKVRPDILKDKFNFISLLANEGYHAKRMSDVTEELLSKGNKEPSPKEVAAVYDKSNPFSDELASSVNQAVALNKMRHPGQPFTYEALEENMSFLNKRSALSAEGLDEKQIKAYKNAGFEAYFAQGYVAAWLETGTKPSDLTSLLKRYVLPENTSKEELSKFEAMEKRLNQRLEKAYATTETLFNTEAKKKNINLSNMDEEQQAQIKASKIQLCQFVLLNQIFVEGGAAAMPITF